VPQFQGHGFKDEEMIARIHLVTIGLVAGLLSAAVSFSAFAESSGCGESAETTSAGNEVKAYIDPDTGELVSGPPPGQVESPDGASAVPDDPAYATEVRPDGTVALDLSGRPAEELHAEEADGNTVLCHRPGSVPQAPPEN